MTDQPTPETDAALRQRQADVIRALFPRTPEGHIDELLDALGEIADREHAALRRVQRLAAVWQDAPDPLARAMAADLHSTLSGPEQEPTVADCKADDAAHWPERQWDSP